MENTLSLSSHLDKNKYWFLNIIELISLCQMVSSKTKYAYGLHHRLAAGAFGGILVKGSPLGPFI